MDHRGTVGRIYKEDHYTLLHTKYGSSGPCGFKEDFFLCLFHGKSMVLVIKALVSLVWDN